MTDDNIGHAIAGRIERERPRWMVVFGGYSGQFVAFPLFDTPSPLRIETRHASQLVNHIERTEDYFRPRR